MADVRSNNDSPPQKVSIGEAIGGIVIFVFVVLLAVMMYAELPFYP